MKESLVQYYIPEAIEGLELLSCSDASYHFSPHFHDSYCIWFNTRSAEAYTLKGNSGLLSIGDIGIIAPGEVHSNCSFDANARQLLTIYLNDSSLRAMSSHIFGHSDSSVEFRTGFYRDKENFTELHSLWHILRQSNSALERQISLCTTFARLISRYSKPSYQVPTVGHEQKRVAQIIELFHERLADNIGLDDLAKQIDCTPFHLIRFFRKAIGLTPHAYLIQLRLEKAKDLLRRGQSLVDVSLSTGFTDQSHLTRHFKQKFGVTPGYYRHQILNS